VFLDVVLYDKKRKYLKKKSKQNFYPPYQGSEKNGPPHYMAKNENHASGLFDSLYEAL
jgi:hypothetical protein